MGAPFHFRERLAHQLGYRVRNDGRLFSPKGMLLDGWTKGGYPHFQVGRNGNCATHRLMAYQKFGEQIYNPLLEVRHLDGNKRNCSWENIGIGTHADNVDDITPEARLQKAIQHCAKLRKHDHRAIISAYQRCRNQNRVRLRFGISSKATMHYIVRRSMVARGLAE